MSTPKGASKTTLAIAIILILLSGIVGFFAGRLTAPAPTTTVTPPAAAKDLFSMTWDEIVQKAKEEGEVTFYGYGADWDRIYFENISKAFEQKYGIKVKYVHGDWFSTIQKLQADKKAGKAVGDVDVALVWSVPFKQALTEGLVWNVPIAEIIPNAKNLIDPSLLYFNDLIPTGGKFIPVVWWQVVFIYNKKYVKPDQLPTLDTLLDWAKKNPGRFTYCDPNKGGSGHTFLISVIYWLYGYDKFVMRPFDQAYADKLFSSPGKIGMNLWDYLNELEKYMYQPGSYPPGNSAAMELFARGEVWLEPQWIDVLAEWIKEGRVNPDDVGVYDPDPGIAVGGFDGVFIPWNAPHKYAALVFINYLLSEEVQYRNVVERGGVYPVVKGVWEKVPQTFKDKWKYLPIEELQSKFLQRHADFMYYAMQQWAVKVGGG